MLGSFEFESDFICFSERQQMYTKTEGRKGKELVWDSQSNGI